MQISEKLARVRLSNLRMSNGKFLLRNRGRPYGPGIRDKEAKLMKARLLKFLRDESGATAIEYGLIAAGISLAIIAAVNGLGTSLSGKFDSINNSLK